MKEVIEGVAFEVNGEDVGALWKARLAWVAGEVALGICLRIEVMAKGLRRTKAIFAGVYTVRRDYDGIGRKVM